MFNTKLLSGILVILAVLFAQVGNAAAAPAAQDTTSMTGTIETITTETDANGITTVLVTLEDEQGIQQTVRLSLETAASLGLVNAATLEVNAGQIGQVVIIDPTSVLPEEETAEEDIHPIAAILANFFGEEPEVIDGYHEDGFGFGVIAQALWMSRNLTSTDEQIGDGSLAEDILQAKQDKDYEAFFEAHPEYLENFDDTLPTNWGQFKKVLREKKNNLGVIVSDQEMQEEATDTINPQEQSLNPGNGMENGQNNGNGNGNGHGNGKNKDKQKKRP
jgi:hypothetical protein